MNVKRALPVLSGALLGLVSGVGLFPFLIMTAFKAAFPDQDGAVESILSFVLPHLVVAGGIVGACAGARVGWLLMKNRTLKRERETMSGALVEKETLLRMLSHDLANHLCVAQGYARLARRESGDLGCDKLDIADKALGKSVNLVRYARRFLALENGKIELDLVEAPVMRAVLDSLEAFREKALAKDVPFDAQAIETDLAAIMDPGIFVSCVMNNLVSNAVKFSIPGGPVSVETTQRPGYVDVSVQNFGPVISSDKKRALFSMNEVTSTQGTAGETGTGFGLPLAARFMERMGGSLTVESDPLTKDGVIGMTVFTASLPTNRKNEKRPPRALKKAGAMSGWQKAFPFVHRPAPALARLG